MKLSLGDFLMKKNQIASAVLTCVATLSHAQTTVPDAGAILNQYNQNSFQKQDAATPAPLAKQEVFKGFAYENLPADLVKQANDITQAYLGQEISTAALIKHLEMQLERRHGVSLVFVPLPDGRLQAIRPVLTAIHIDNQSKVDDGLLRRTLNRGIETGQVLNRMALEARSMVANEIPGITHEYRMTPGTAEGSTELQMTTKDGKATDGYVGVDNNGTTATGIWQALAGLSSNNRLGMGERIALNLLKTENGRYSGLIAEAPVAINDLRVGVSASDYEYDYLVSSTSNNGSSLFSNYKGGARNYGVHAVYALSRSEFERSNFTVGYDRKASHSNVDIDAIATNGTKNSAAFELSKWHIESVDIGYNRQQAMPNRARTSYSINASFGLAKQKYESAAQTDAAGAKQQGHYKKLNFQGQYSLPLSLQNQDDYTLTLSAAGQISDKNLPNSEKFNVGGFNTMKAWSPQITAGDNAMWLEIKAEKFLTPQVKVGAFAEMAVISTNKHPYETISPDRQLVRFDDKNRLSDVGFIATYMPAPNMEISGSVAIKTSNDPKAYNTPIASTNKQHGDVMGYVRLMYRF